MKAWLAETWSETWRMVVAALPWAIVNGFVGEGRPVVQILSVLGALLCGWGWLVEADRG